MNHLHYFLSIVLCSAVLTPAVAHRTDIESEPMFYLATTLPGSQLIKVVYAVSPEEQAPVRCYDRTADGQALWQRVKNEKGKGFYLYNATLKRYLAVKNGVVVTVSQRKDATSLFTADDNLNIITTIADNTPPTCKLLTSRNTQIAPSSKHVMVMEIKADTTTTNYWTLLPSTDKERDLIALSHQQKETYHEVWKEEFNTNGPFNTLDWNAATGFIRNHEDQWYQPENAWVADGCLIIEGRKTERPNPLYEAGSDNWRKNRPMIHYTSACLDTRGKHEWLYGRFEIRAKIPTARGSWPAIWFLGNNDIAGPWPYNGEIDLMEYYPDKQGVGLTRANIAWGSTHQYIAHWETSGEGRPVQEYWCRNDASWVDRFHIWTMIWTPDAIKMYLDNELTAAVNSERLINDETPWAKVRRPFQYPLYLLINLALGGDNGGAIDDTALPIRYLIDYIRVYQQTEQ